MLVGNRVGMIPSMILGLKPCCAACLVKVFQSGSIMTPWAISQPCFLNSVICLVKVLARLHVGAAVDEGVALGRPVFAASVGLPVRVAGPLLGHTAAIFLVGIDLAEHVPLDLLLLGQPPEEVVSPFERLVRRAPRWNTKTSTGTSMERQGMLLPSHMSATGATVSPVAAHRIRSTLVLLMRSPATWEARLVSDWLSTTCTSNMWFLPSPSTTPFAVSRLPLGDAVAARHTEGRQRPGERVDEPDFDRPAGLNAGARGSRFRGRGGAGSRRRRGRGGRRRRRSRGGPRATAGCHQPAKAGARPDGRSRDPRDFQEFTAAYSLALFEHQNPLLLEKQTAALGPHCKWFIF